MTEFFWWLFGLLCGSCAVYAILIISGDDD